jgi:hypothetical protein
MNDAAILERRYRRLLRWHPRWFRDDAEDEVLGVLMAGAGDGRRWPSAAEAADVLWSALRLRLRPPPGSPNPGWSGAWAAFSVLAPVLLLVATLMVVEVPPYGLPARPHAAGGTALPAPSFHNWLQHAADTRAFCILLLFQAAAVIAVLAGRRWVALAVTWGSAWYTFGGPRFEQFPMPVVLLTAAWYILQTSALLASPGPRRGRTLLTWRHGAVLVLAAGAVKLSALTWFTARSGAPGNKPLAGILVIVAAVLAVAAVAGPAAVRREGRISLLMAALLYPYVIEFVFRVVARHAPLPGPVPLTLAIVFLLPLALAAFAALTTARRRLASSEARPTPGN